MGVAQGSFSVGGLGSRGQHLHEEIFNNRNANHYKTPVIAVVFFPPKAFVFFSPKPCDYSGQKATVLCVRILDITYIILRSQTIQSLESFRPR
jgi:hypothetical protein